MFTFGRALDVMQPSLESLPLLTVVDTTGEALAKEAEKRRPAGEVARCPVRRSVGSAASSRTI